MKTKTKIIKYKCKENDNHIRFIQEPGDDTGEFWFSDELQKSWVVIGAKDLAKALAKVGFSVATQHGHPWYK